MKRAEDWEGSLEHFIGHYQYQPELTKCLDALGPPPFTQDVINDIVLWKVNRYVKLTTGVLKALDSIAGLQAKSHRNASDTLAILLRAQGVDLPMASTFLRFRNPEAFQIIDRHAYRAAYGQGYPLYSSSTHNAKIDLYFRYLDDLWALAESRNVDFRLLDRVLYVFDKEVSGKL